MAEQCEPELRKDLASEGFAHIFVWEDGPGVLYPDHTHAGLTAHIILDGEMTLTTNGKPPMYRAGVGTWWGGNKS